MRQQNDRETAAKGAWQTSGMATEAHLPTRSQIANAVGKVAQNGLGRPLYSELTETDIAPLLSIADALGVNPGFSPERRVAEVVLPAIRALTGPKRTAACYLLWIEDIDSPPVSVGADGPRILLGEDGGRHELAASVLGVAPSSFERRKKGVLLRDIADAILALVKEHRSQPEPPSDTATLINLDEPPPHPAAHGLAWKSCEFHYSVLVALFVDDFSHSIPRADAFGRENHYPSWYGAWHSCAARIMGRYLEWAGFYHFLKLGLGNEEELSDHLQEQLAALYEATVHCGPPFVLEMDGTELVDLSTRDFDSIAVIEMPEYSEYWHPWYEREIAYPDPEGQLDLPRQVGLVPSATPTNLRLFAANSMEMYRLIEREVDLALPFDDMARTRAFKDITSCYLFDEWTPLYGGPSLRDRITAFIHNMQAELRKGSKTHMT